MCQPKAKERPETGVGLMATYRQILEWVSRNQGFRPKSCWIAHCKEMAGLKPGRAPNRQGDRRMLPCPSSKRLAILAAFRHFHMLGGSGL